MTNKDKLLLLLCGSMLMLTQYIAVREIGSTFFSTEIITIISVIMVMIGPSVAYFLSDKISDKQLFVWAMVTVPALISLPFSVRYLVTLMKAMQLEFFAMLFVFLFGSLFFSGFFAVFLPRLSTGTKEFKVLYALELIGAVLALVLVGVAGAWHVIISLYWLILAIVVQLSLKRKAVSAVTVLVAFASILAYPYLNQTTAEAFYSVYWEKKDPQLLETVYSPYQRIDVVKDAKGKSLYLDGVPYYESGDLHWFNYYIADLPGRLVTSGKNALIIGSGTLSSTGYLVHQGFDVTTVDIDARVAQLGMKYFNDLNKLKKDEYKLVIADARRYVKDLPAEKYDLIVLDIPAPYHLQTALLYVPSFLEDLKSCLKPSGVLTMNTCSYKLNDQISSSITASALSVFKEVYSVEGDSLGLTVLYCSRKLPFTLNQLQKELAKNEKDRFNIKDRKAVKFTVGNTKPHTEENLMALLLLSRYEFPENEKWLGD